MKKSFFKYVLGLGQTAAWIRDNYLHLTHLGVIIPQQDDLRRFPETKFSVSTGFEPSTYQLKTFTIGKWALSQQAIKYLKAWPVVVKDVSL